MTFFKWSKVAATNATADSTINLAEGMAPSAVNDSARAMMAAARKYADDVAGAIATGGSATAYTVTSLQVFTTLALMSGNVIAFTPHAANTGTVTLNVDGLGAKALRLATGVEAPAGSFVIGTPYLALYNNANSEFIVMNGGSASGVPVGSGTDFWGTSAPSGWLFAYGQAISRTTYAALFAVLSTTYGVGDGSTTFNLPDKRGRASFGKDDMGGSSANRITDQTGGWNGDTLGATGGTETHTLTTAQLASHSHTISDPTHSHSASTSIIDSQTLTAPTSNSGAGSDSTTAAASASGTVNNNITVTETGAITASTTVSAASTGITGTATAGSGSAHNNLPPGIVCNYIIKVL